MPLAAAAGSSVPVEALETIYTLLVVAFPLVLIPLWIRGERKQPSKDGETDRDE
jgi:hypothetical protein